MMADAFHHAGSSLPPLPRRAPLQERSHGTRGATGQVQRLSTHVHARSERTASQSGVKEAGAFGLPGSHEHPGHPPHLRRLLPDGHEVAGGKKRTSFPPSRTRSYPVSAATCLNSMNSGALWAAKPTPCGCGWPFVVVLARSSLGHSVTAAYKARATCGRTCPKATDDVPLAATTGTPTPRRFPNALTVAVARKRARLAMWSVGLAPCEPEPVAWCAGLTPSPNAPRTTSTPSTSSSPTTISPSNRLQHSTNHPRRDLSFRSLIHHGFHSARMMSDSRARARTKSGGKSVVGRARQRTSQRRMHRCA